MRAGDGGAVRLFFALVPPAPLQQRLGALAKDLAPRVHGRPVPAQNIHLTLAFIGAWPVARVPLLLGIGSRLRGDAAELTLDTLGGFSRARVAWIGASSEPASLANLAAALWTELSGAGIAVDPRPLHPHLTLARQCGGPYPRDATGPFKWLVDDVSLMQSDTRPDGARYTAIAHWRLGFS